MTMHQSPGAVEVPVSGGRDPFDLERFVNAQAGGVFEAALAEIEQGRKRTHWMWFIFPQLQGLGTSAMSARFAISGIAEARAYLEHELLGPRLRACAAATLPFADAGALALFGSPDHLKLWSSMTLFAAASDDASVFREVIDAFFAGVPDPAGV